MSFEINSVLINSGDMLDELVVQSLDKILGTPHRLISRDLPFNFGRAILALDHNEHPALIIADRHDGGQALLKGLKVLEAMEKQRASVFRLYPELFGNKRHALRINDIHLYIMAPTTPPGGDYLRREFTRLHIRTFRPLLINGEPGLLIDTPRTAPAQSRNNGDDQFRTGATILSPEEAAYFDTLTIPG